VLPALDRRFDEFLQQITAEIEDRAAIRRRAVERHRDSKTATLLSQQERNRSRAEAYELTGDRRRARQLISVNVAIEGKLRKLREACELRLSPALPLLPFPRLRTARAWVIRIYGKPSFG
jgi:hypothetical protein